MVFKSDRQRKAAMANIQDKKGFLKGHKVKPGFPTKSNVNNDVKKIMRSNKSVSDNRKDYKRYRRNLRNHADIRYHKELNKARRRERKQDRFEENQIIREENDDLNKDHMDLHVNDPKSVNEG